ncbi:hypothetical protein K439DRAFT_1381895 [Ramaria rubella]|nr:hypothetical protein K439DRAFT_1381895 [Ramaria rubella]
MSSSSKSRAGWQPGHKNTLSAAPSRYSYPSFIPFPDTLKLHLSFLRRGIVDASRWDVTIQLVYSDAEIRSHIVKSFLLNSLSLVSIYALNYVLLPVAARGRVHHHVGWLYRVLWLIPLAATSLYFNGTWAGVVAKRSYTLQRGMRSAVPTASYSGMLTAMASSAYRVVMILTSITLTNVLSHIPIVGPMAAFAFLCWMNAYYCFEFIWITQGLSLSQRVRFLEERWAYYFAFGLPSASVCAFFPGLAGAEVFALLLPAYIIKASRAHPVPVNPYSPASITRGAGQAQHSPEIIYPSPFIPIRIPIFYLVITINNFVVHMMSIGSPSGSRIQTVLKETTERRQLSGDAEVASNAEEGNGNFHGRRNIIRKID